MFGLGIIMLELWYQRDVFADVSCCHMVYNMILVHVVAYFFVVTDYFYFFFSLLTD